MKKTITWLHLSDLHLCNPKSGWEAEYILEKLQDDLHRLQNEYGLSPDLIFFTGDAAFGHLEQSGGKSITEQFEAAAGLFEAIRHVFTEPIPIDRFFIVPGNHDVNRSKVNKWMHQGFDKELEEKKDYDTIEKALSQLLQEGGSEWQGFMDRFFDYNQFVKKNGYRHLLQDPDSEKRVIYAVTCLVNGINVGIAGLNSAWSCYQDKEKSKLWLAGHWQIQTLYQKLKSAELKIALMHHPVNWFNQVEDPAIQREMQNHFDFFLTC